MGDSDLEKRVNSLRRDLAQKEKDLMLAAEIGKQLLESNNEYSRQLENVSTENSVKLEVSFAFFNIPHSQPCILKRHWLLLRNFAERGKKCCTAETLIAFYFPLMCRLRSGRRQLICHLSRYRKQAVVLRVKQPFRTQNQ